MSQVAIVPFADIDFDTVTAIWFDSAASMGIPMPVSLADLRERWPKELAAGWIVHVAKENGAPVGFVALQAGTIAQLFIAPAHQGRGIGKMLLNLAKANMPDGFTLTTPVVSRAGNFYEREGLVRGETSTHHFGHQIVRYDWKPSTPRGPVAFEPDPQGRLFHGTKIDLKPGDLIGPGYTSNYGEGRKANYVYFSGTLDAATWGAELAQGEGPGRIYIVEPTGPVMDDPNLTDRKFPGNPTRSYRSRDPVRVVGEITDWQGHAPETLQAMKANLERLRQQGAAIDD